VSNNFSPDLPVPAISATRVLAFIYDRMLVAVRTSVLRHSGYEVEETFSGTEALARAKSDSIDALLICHSVPDSEIQKLVAVVRQTRLRMPILCIRTHQYGFAPRSCVPVDNSPAAILRALQAAVQSYKPPNRSRLRLAS
jgi:CheY-like chemotaxis protein